MKTVVYYFNYFLILITFGFLAFTNSCKNTTSESNSQLIVGLQGGYPPFEFRHSNGELVGFDIAIAHIIAEKLNRTLVIKDMDFDGTILSLKQGKIDLIISGMNITSSRMKEIQMIPYHGENVKELTLIFWNEIPQGVTSIDDIATLPNSSISVEAGSIAEQYLKRFKKINAKSFESVLNSLLDVKYGKSTANLVQPDVATYLKSQHPEINTLSVPLNDEDQIMGFGIGVKKGNRLFEQVFHIISELKKSGELRELENMWFHQEEQ